MPRPVKPRPASGRPAWQTAYAEPRQAATPTHTPRPPGRTEFLRFSPRSPFHPRGAPRQSADENTLNTKRCRPGQERLARSRPSPPTTRRAFSFGRHSRTPLLTKCYDDRIVKLRLTRSQRRRRGCRRTAKSRREGDRSMFSAKCFLAKHVFSPKNGPVPGLCSSPGRGCRRLDSRHFGVGPANAVALGFGLNEALCDIRGRAESAGSGANVLRKRPPRAAARRKVEPYANGHAVFPPPLAPLLTRHHVEQRA